MGRVFCNCSPYIFVGHAHTELGAPVGSLENEDPESEDRRPRKRKTHSKKRTIKVNSKARFPHRSLLHHAYAPLFQENNSDNNRRPLGLWRFVLSSRGFFPKRKPQATQCTLMERLVSQDMTLAAFLGLRPTETSGYLSLFLTTKLTCQAADSYFENDIYFAFWLTIYITMIRNYIHVPRRAPTI